MYIVASIADNHATISGHAGKQMQWLIDKNYL